MFQLTTVDESINAFSYRPSNDVVLPRTVTVDKLKSRNPHRQVAQSTGRRQHALRQDILTITLLSLCVCFPPAPFAEQFCRLASSRDFHQIGNDAKNLLDWLVVVTSTIAQSLKEAQVLLRRNHADGVCVALAASPALDSNNAITFTQDSQLDPFVDPPLKALINVLLPVDTTKVWFRFGKVARIHSSIEVSVSRGRSISRDHDDRAYWPVFGEQPG